MPKMPCHITDEFVPDNPQNRPDDTRQCEECLICGSILLLDRDMGWMLENGPYCSEAAGTCPGGFVCGSGCRSQAMYNVLGDNPRIALRVLLNRSGELLAALKALGVSQQYQHSGKSIVAPFLDDSAYTALFDALTNIQKQLLGDQNEDSPEWTDGLA